MPKQVFILEVDSDTEPAVLTARIRQECGLFIGKDAYTLWNAVGALDTFGEPAATSMGVTQHLGCDPKLAREVLI
jgi:hypothetical protein